MNVTLEQRPGKLLRLVIKDRQSYIQTNTKTYDDEAMRYLSIVLFPCIVGYFIYSCAPAERALASCNAPHPMCAACVSRCPARRSHHVRDGRGVDAAGTSALFMIASDGVECPCGAGSSTTSTSHGERARLISARTAAASGMLSILEPSPPCPRRCQDAPAHRAPSLVRAAPPPHMTPPPSHAVASLVSR